MSRIRLVVAVCLTGLILSGCTLQMDNPFVKKEPPEMKLVRERIAAYELLEREAELVHSINKLKKATAEIGVVKEKAK